MQFHRPLALVGTVVLAASLAACGHSRPAPAPQYSGGYSSGYQTAPAYPQQQAGTEYGRVSNIEVLQGRSQGQTTGTGAVLGAVVGGCDRQRIRHQRRVRGDPEAGLRLHHG